MLGRNRVQGFVWLESTDQQWGFYLSSQLWFRLDPAFILQPTSEYKGEEHLRLTEPPSEPWVMFGSGAVWNVWWFCSSFVFWTQTRKGPERF